MIVCSECNLPKEFLIAGYCPSCVGKIIKRAKTSCQLEETQRENKQLKEDLDEQRSQWRALKKEIDEIKELFIQLVKWLDSEEKGEKE